MLLVTKEFYYIGTPAGLTSVYEKVNSSGAMYYLHPDYLGSVHLITNSAGATVQELGFDACSVKLAFHKIIGDLFL